MRSAKPVERLVDVERRHSRIDLQPEVDPGAVRRRVDAQPDRREIRIRLGMEELDRLARADRPFDVDRRRLAEGDVDGRSRPPASPGSPPSGPRRRARRRARRRRVVLADVDQRILFGELRERDAEPCPVVGPLGDDDRLQRRRRELTVATRRSRARRSGRRPGSRRGPRALPLRPRRPPGAARRVRARRPRSPSPCRRAHGRSAAARARESSPRTSGRTRSSRRSHRARS